MSSLPGSALRWHVSATPRLATSSHRRWLRPSREASMSETESYPRPSASRTDGLVAQDDPEQYRAEFDFSAAAAWLRRNHVLAAGMLLIAAAVAWKTQFLSHMYFSQDDYVNQDIAATSPFSWH